MNHAFFIILLLNTIFILYSIISFFEFYFLNKAQGKKISKIKKHLNRKNSVASYRFKKSSPKVKYLYFFIIIFIYIIMYIFFYPIFYTESFIFPYSIHPFNIVKEFPEVWKTLLTYFNYSNILVFVFINISVVIKARGDRGFVGSSKINIFKRKDIDRSNGGTKIKKRFDGCIEDLNILVGFNEQKKPILLNEKSLFQNILVTGSIGSGKTSSVIYPICMQLLAYSGKDKIGGLILDVKGNLCEKVEEILKKANRANDLIVIDLSGNTRYNPLDKPNLNPEIIANRLKNILLLFSPQTTESFWQDKAELLITECIKFIRIYNDGYVSFTELQKIINDSNYYNECFNIAKDKFYSGTLSKEEMYNFSTFIDFYENEFLKLDIRTSSIIRAEISRITSIFISNYKINKVFCPNRDKINFSSFDSVIEEGKIVVLNLNIADYSSLSKIIAAYLKQDFQTTVINRISKGKAKTSFFICDEYQEYVTKNDASFYSLSREAKCINLISTQSYSSLKNAICSQESTEVIIQNFVNKIWLRTDDFYTIKSIISQLGKEEKKRTSVSFSENAKASIYNPLTSNFFSDNSGISESFSNQTYFEDKISPEAITQNLKSFEALCFLSDGNKILPVQKIKLIPYFLIDNGNNIK